MMPPVVPGQMMYRSLLISTLLKHAAIHHGDVEIVSRRVEGDIFRYTYRDLVKRARKLAKAMETLGVAQGDRVATLAWNTYRHMEIYFASSGMGAVCHTVNPRLFPQQVSYIINHAEDQIVFFDLTFVSLVEQLAPLCPSVKTWICMTDNLHMPQCKVPLTCYRDLIRVQDDRYEWPEFDENSAASLCYTSGTTGNPKGALYSHRSTLLHTAAIVAPDAFCLGSADAIMPVVPMYHVNAWGLPYAAAMVGAKLVLPGAQLDGASLYELFESEKVTFSGGVPTLWQGLLNYVKKNNLRFSTSSGPSSAAPPARRP